MNTLTIKQRLEKDLAKCKPLTGYRPIWVLAEDNNKKDKVVNVKQVKSLPIFMGL